MTSAAPNASSSGGKSLNISSSSSHLPPQHQAQPSTPSSESGSRRSGNSGPVHGSARNNQGYRKQHKNSRRPRAVDDDTMSESGAMRNPNGRRGQTSITHLMNFSLPPHPQEYRNTFGRGTRRGNIYGIGSGHHSNDKARYIHANYRFIVKPNGDYKQQSVNADRHLDWDDVLQILASAVSQEASCPICLSHPVAPRMAKCGHIFCLPCLIRFMHSSDDENIVPEKKARWKKCPICWDSIYLSDTRPVRWFTGQEGQQPREGDDVVLRLVMRLPGSTLALPRDGADALGKPEDVPWYFAAEVTDYARIMKGGEQYMMEQFDAEIEDLHRQENEDELMFGEDPEWTRKAIKAVTEAKEKMKGIGDPPAPKQPSERKPKREPIQFNPINEDAPEMYFVQYASTSSLSLPNGDHTASIPEKPDDHATEQQPTSQIPEKPTHSHPHPNPRPRNVFPGTNEAHHPDTPYFFYQALLHYYLAPLDIRILKSAFGDFASFPTTLLPRVERVSTGHIVDDDLRKRAKYLAHLPYGCEVGFLECNWTDVVPPDILSHFKEDIERRRRRNRDKETREEKDRVRAEKAEDDARWANARRKRPGSIPERYTPENFHSSAPSLLDEGNSSPPWPTRQGSSFASLASPSTSPSAPRTVWGTAMVPPGSPTMHAQPEANYDDGWLSSWEQTQIAESELIAQVQASSLKEAETEEVKPSGGGGKKKKAKKITLMSTNARRAA